MNTLRRKNQSIPSTPQSLHFTLTILPNLLEPFLFFYATPRLLPQGRNKTYKRAAGRQRPTTRKRARGPRLPRSRPRRRAPPTAPAFPGQSRQGTVAATADG